MDTTSLLALIVLIFAAALLYSSVGHAGASGYLAAMAFVGVSPAVMKPVALVLNVLVALIATVKFYRAGCFSWALFWPFAVASVPCAFIGGSLSLSGALYKPLVGLVLLYAASRLVRGGHTAPGALLQPPPLVFSCSAGAGIGLLSGLTGVGGGIFLSPLLLLQGWAETRQSSGVSAAFILVNSLAALAGLGLRLGMVSFPDALPLWAVAAIVGGWIGAAYGSRHFATVTLQRLLAVVLIIAGGKLILVI